MGIKPNDKCPYKRPIEIRHSEKRRPYDPRAKNANNYLGKARTESPLQPLVGAWLCGFVASNFSELVRE